jgi:tetratricopeptide (TPR) repeat protein
MRRLVFAPVLVALLLLPVLSCRLDRRGAIRRVMVVEGPAWVDVSPAQRMGLRLLLEDLAETGGATVLKPPPAGGPPLAGVLRITLEGSLTGSGLRLQARIHGADGSERDLVPASSDPRNQLQQVLAGAGFRSPAAAAILPNDPARLLPLAEVYAATLAGNDQEARAAGALAQAIAAQEPECAPAALSCAESAYRRLLNPSAANLEAQMVCSQAFESALNLLPGYPRAAVEAGRFYTDTGNQRRALELLFNAADLRPRSSGLRIGMAYAARTTGLLEGARTALRAREALEGGAAARDLFPETTFLYTGEWDRFDAWLGSGPGERPDPLPDFYRGYLRLLQGRRDEALANFRAAERPQESNVQFQSLARAYQLALDGHRPEALLTLRLLTRSRQDLRVPDGEFTFKVAEAYAFVGASDEAMDEAQHAFSQGFGCTPWYERTPMLATLHELPRWRALISHLQERQKLLEERFPVSGFGAKVPGV